MAYSSPMRGDHATGPGEGSHDPTDALRAEAQHWRDLAGERDAAIRSLTRRPLVRIAVAIDRRARPLGRRIGSWAARLRSVVDRGRIAAMSLRARWTRRRRAAALASQISGLAVASDGASVSLVALDACGGAAGRSSTGVAVEVVAVGRGGLAARHDADGNDADGNDADVHVASDGLGRLAALARGVAAATGDVLCFVPGPLEPLAPGWLACLSGALGGDVVAATPTLVHPDRRGWRTTEHDQLVRSEGFDLAIDSSGAPVVVARRAGQAVEVGGAPADVDAAPLQCLVVARESYVAAGGLEDLGDDDAAAADLCMRLRRLGGRVVHVPTSVVVDGRPALSRRSLHRPVDAQSPGWRSFVDRNGPAATRLALQGVELTARRWVITTAVPSARIAGRWGDWHLAEALARSLRTLGQDVVVQTHDQADSLASRSRDVHLVVHGLAAVRKTLGQRHIVWVVSHPETVDAMECDAADLVVVASSRFAEHLRTRTRTPVEVLLQATDVDRFRPCTPAPEHQHAVTVVAKTRNVLRQVVADALATGIRPAIYGGGWEHLVDPSLVVADHVDNDELPIVYSSAGVVLNDHWDTMGAWGFVSNRIFDVLACGTPIISDDVAEIRELFGDAVPTYRTSGELGELVRDVLEHPEVARARAARGRSTVLAHHTFDHRARQLLELLERHQLADDVGVVPA